MLALLALCSAADGALRGAVAPRDANEQRAKSRRALEEVIEVVPAAEAAALAEQQAAAAAMAKAEAMMAAAKAAQAKAEADELEARAGATTSLISRLCPIRFRPRIWRRRKQCWAASFWIPTQSGVWPMCCSRKRFI